MNQIDSIVIHCSATKEGVNIRAKDIESWHKQRGLKKIGYHYIIDIDGTIETGRPLNEEGAHCSAPGLSGISYNKHSVGICYIGGLGKDGKPKDTRTIAQKKSLHELVKKLCQQYQILEILGHRDTSPDLDGNGLIESNEWLKECPCFDVATEFPNYLKAVIITP